MTSDDDFRARKHGETNLQWEVRVIQEDLLRRQMDGPLLPREAEQHAEYIEGFVMHAETNTLAHTKRRKSASGLVRLHENGKIDNDQFGAAMEIVDVIESLTRAVAVGRSNYEMRVDCGHTPLGNMLEHIGWARLEMAYSRWRIRIPTPKRMILDMLVVDRSLAATARVYHMSWHRARDLLTDALDLWIEIRDDIAKRVDQDDLDAAHARLLTSVNGKGI